MKEIDNVKFYKGDFLDEKCKNLILQNFRGKADVILSDMAADTTGNSSWIASEQTYYAKRLLHSPNLF